MRVAGGERVLNALLSCTARLRVRGYITVFPRLVRELELEKAYKIYVTDALRAIAENTSPPASYFTDGNVGKYPAHRFAELFDTKPVETRTPEEIVSHILKKLKEDSP